MKGYKTNIEKETLKNKNFRKVVYTGAYSQLVLMSLKPKEEIGSEVHAENDQFLSLFLPVQGTTLSIRLRRKT